MIWLYDCAPRITRLSQVVRYALSTLGMFFFASSNRLLAGQPLNTSIRAMSPDFFGNYACPQGTPQPARLNDQNIFLNQSIKMTTLATFYQPQLLLAARLIALPLPAVGSKDSHLASPSDVKKLAESYTEL